MDKKVAKEYAIALFDISLEKNIIEIIKDEFIITTKVFSKVKDFVKLLSHPQLSVENKKDIINNVFNDINQTLKHFLYVLIENSRIVDINAIRDVFIEIYNEYNNVYPVIAKTTIPLTSEQINTLEKKLSIKYRHKIQLENIIDPTIIGGLTLSIKNQVYDYTIKTQIENLKSHILKHT